MSTTVATNAKGGKGSGGNRRHGHGSNSNNSTNTTKQPNEKPEKVDRAEKPEKPEKADKAEKTERKASPQTQPAQPQLQSQTPTQQQHPLNRKWTLWYDSPSTYNTDNWELSLLPIMTVSTVEEFFVMLRYMKPLHELRTSSQYHFFQDPVKPMWEDPANKDGGKIWVNIEIPNTPLSGAGAATPSAANADAAAAAQPPPPPQQQSGDEKKPAGTPNSGQVASGKPELDQVWERVLMAVIGEYLEPSTDPEKKEGGSEKPQIVGAVMAKRKYHNRLALWVRDAGNSEAIEAMKKKLKEEASLPVSASFVFTKHGESGGKN